MLSCHLASTWALALLDYATSSRCARRCNQHFESACAYEGAVYTLTCVLFFWNAELLLASTWALLERLSQGALIDTKSVNLRAFVYEALSTLTGVLCFWNAELHLASTWAATATSGALVDYNQYLNLRCIRGAVATGVSASGLSAAWLRPGPRQRLQRTQVRS
jgi:hypothetical protein